jgi:hypothetical protein
MHQRTVTRLTHLSQDEARSCYRGLWERMFVHDTNLKGALAEAEIATAAIRAGVPVLKPLSEHGRYDLAPPEATEEWPTRLD